VISGFRQSVNEIFALLGLHAKEIACYLPTFLDNLSGSFSRFENSKILFEMLDP
jgi:hypothetical protein